MLKKRLIGSIRYRIIDPFRRFLKYRGLWFPSINSYKKMTRFFNFKDLYDKIENIEGDIVETGVAFGYSLIVFGILAKQEGKGRKIIGFDSFEQGFPEPSQFDKSKRNTKKGDFSTSTLARVKKILSKVDIEEPILVKGFFEDTLPKYNFKNGIALLHIDADIYIGYKNSLDYLYDQVAKGGIIAFDEYNDEKWPGATKAVNEFLEKTGEKIQKARYIEKYYVVKSK